MVTRPIHPSRAALVSAVLAVGCIFSGRVSSGVDPSLALPQTSPDDRVALCQADVKYRYVVSSGNLRCKAVAADNATGATDDDLRFSCNSLTHACLDEGVPGKNQDDELEECKTDPGNADLYDCAEVTVGDLERCESDRLDQYSMAVNELPDCDELSARELSEFRAKFAPSAIPSCKPLYDACN
jgi:hypothetical protein